MTIDTIDIQGRVTYSANEGFVLECELNGSLAHNRFPQSDLATYSLPELFEAQKSVPMPLPLPRAWVFRGFLLRCSKDAEAILGRDRLTMLIKHRVMLEEQRWTKIACEVEAYANIDLLPAAPLERISPAVRMFVWHRDEGKCAECGSEAALEYDRLISVAEGGSSTARNIRILCEICKSAEGH